MISICSNNAVFGRLLLAMLFGTFSTDSFDDILVCWLLDCEALLASFDGCFGLNEL